MTELWSEARLARVLVSVGEHLDTDPAAATAIGSVSTTDRFRSPRSRRWLAIAAAVAAVLVGATLAIAPVREAVADFLGIGSTGIDVVPESEADPTGLPTIEAGLREITPAAAASRLGQALPDVAATSLGEPDRIMAMPEGGVLLAWADGATTLWIHEGLMPGDMLFKKLLDAGQAARSIDGLGDSALAVTGEHILETPSRRLKAGTVLLWTDEAIEYRLESDLDEATMLAIAHDLD